MPSVSARPSASCAATADQNRSSTRRSPRAGRPVRRAAARTAGAGTRTSAGRPGAAAGEDRRPVDGHAADVRLGERGKQPRQAALVAAQRADDRRVRASGVRRRSPGCRAEHGVRADLDEHPVARASAARPSASVEPHGLAQVAVPVLGVQGGGVDPLAGHRGVERDRRRRAASIPARSASEPFADRLDLGGVRGVVDRDELRRGCRRRCSVRTSSSSASPRRRRRRPSRARSPRRPTAPSHGAMRSRTSSAGSATDAMPPRPDRSRRCAWLRSATTRAASSSDSAPATHAAAISPWRVADDGVRLDAVGAPQRGQRHHHREQRGLDDVDPVERGRAGCRAARRAATSRRAARGRRRTRRCARANTGDGRRAARRAMPAHCEPWPGKTKTALPPPAGAGDQVRGRAARRPARQGRVRSVVPVVAERRRPGARGPRGVVASERPTSASARRRRPGEHAARRPAPRSACAGAGGRRQRHRRHGGHGRDGDRSARRALGGGLGGSGACSRMTWALVPLMPNDETPARRGRSGPRPRRGLGQQLDARRRTSRRAAIGSSTCSVRGSTPCRIAMHHLDDAGDAGGGLGVADVRLDRAEPQRPVARSWP